MNRGDSVVTHKGRVGVFDGMHANPDFAYVLFPTIYPGDLADINVPRVVPWANLELFESTLEDLLS